MKKQTIKSHKPKTRVTWGFSPVTRMVKSKKTTIEKPLNKNHLNSILHSDK